VTTAARDVPTEAQEQRAREHLARAEREAATLPDGSVPPPYVVRTAAVVGAGTMGVGIAMACANAGIEVTLIEPDPEQGARARSTIAATYEASVRKGKLDAAEGAARGARIRGAGELDAAAGAELVIEAVFEEAGLKREIFAKLDRIAAPGALLATNTSTLDVDAIASATERPQDVCGMHFFSPANVMRLLEIVRGERSSRETLGRALGIAAQLRKVPVIAGNCDGFIGNRMVAVYKREVDFLLEEGATPQQIDRVIKDFGFAMGPVAMSDLAGLDVGWRIRKRRYAEHPPEGRYSAIEDVLCEMGRYGQKTGAGFYRYAAGDRTPIPDPEVDALIERLAGEAGIARRAVSDDEILVRCLYPLVNEAAKILEEGYAARPGDVDVVYVYGYGFPASRGGPLYWADTVGLAAIETTMRALEQVHGDTWTPAPLLHELALHGGTFAGWKGAP
jgi:3-hydroxyacyl-CoA dehydrogenase